MLSGYGIERIVSSPHARCVETVEALADQLGVDVELRDELVPEASKRELVSFLSDLPAPALVCTHREVFETLFDGEITCEKSGSWLVERRDARLVPVAYVPPPSSVSRVRTSQTTPR
jgi:phosphohistidine phosphatase SixA